MHGSEEVIQVLWWKRVCGVVHPRTKAGCVWEKSLMAAVSRGRGVDVVEVLVKAGVGVEGVDAAGNPLLNVATRLRNADVVRMLVEVGGADVKQTWGVGGDAFECVFFRV